MKLIVGLGNPGNEYVNTRHNIGYMFVDYLFGDRFVINKKFKAMEFETMIGGEKIIVIKPMTYMNLSGESVLMYMNYYKIDVADVLVIQDDLNLDVGRYKLLFNHGDGGHNGIKNIINNLNSRAFLRLKIGINKSGDIDTKEYVLGKFSKDELNIIKETFSKLDKFLDDYLKYNKDILMGKYNVRVLEG